MSKWENLNLDEKIIEILSNVHYKKPEHHLGRPFLTAYQIAIELGIRFPDEVKVIGFQLREKEQMLKTVWLSI